MSRAATTRGNRRPSLPATRRKQSTDAVIMTSSLAAPLDWARYVAPLLILAIGVLLAAFELGHSGGYAYADWHGNSWSNYDEGVYIVSARALNQGYSIFSQVFS